MKCTINGIDIKTRCDYVTINQNRNKDNNYQVEYNCRLQIETSKELNNYEKEKIEDWIRKVINKD